MRYTGDVLLVVEEEPGLFDHVLVNSDLDLTYKELKSVLMKVITESLLMLVTLMDSMLNL